MIIALSDIKLRCAMQVYFAVAAFLRLADWCCHAAGRPAKVSAGCQGGFLRGGPTRRTIIRHLGEFIALSCKELPKDTRIQEALMTIPRYISRRTRRLRRPSP
ncbi:hypothetical protein [Marinovum algicola]|uniref:hypothetical protein n=1 Tax=Marinovum algicola TaxID=42444 RepID=UPI0024B9AA0A|nr:hypothetical protein [Marinovum algicola]